MKLFGLEIGRAKPASGTAGSGAPRAALDAAALSAELQQLLGLTGATPLGNLDNALKVAAVYRCWTLISGAVATMPLALMTKTGEARRPADADHPLVPLLARRPNPWQTPSQFRRQLQGHLLSRGAAFAMKARAGDRVAGLIPLHPDRVRVFQEDDWRLRYEYQRRDGRITRLVQADMLHLVGHTLDGVNGVSPLGMARGTVGLALAMQRHAQRTFANGARISGTLSHPQELGPEGADRLRSSLQAFRDGGDREGGDLILEEGMKYERMGLTMEDAQFVEQGVAGRTEIYMYFGVPPHMAGDTSKSTSWGSGIEQQSLGFVAYTLEDWLTTWEQTLARDLLLDGGRDRDLYFRFNRAALVRGDLKTRTAAYGVYRQWGLATINELRALEEWGPIEGGDELFAGGNGQRTSEPPAEPDERMPADVEAD